MTTIDYKKCYFCGAINKIFVPVIKLTELFYKRKKERKFFNCFVCHRRNNLLKCKDAF